MTGHAHFIEFNETLTLRIESPFDTVLITVHHHLDHAPTAGSGGAGDGADAGAALALDGALASFARLPLDARFLRGRGCALPLAGGDGETNSPDKRRGAGGHGGQGLLELEASWADPDP